MWKPKFLKDAIQQRLAAPELTRREIELPVSSASGGLAQGFATLDEGVAAADLEEDRRKVR